MAMVKKFVVKMKEDVKPDQSVDHGNKRFCQIGKVDSYHKKCREEQGEIDFCFYQGVIVLVSKSLLGMFRVF